HVLDASSPEVFTLHKTTVGVLEELGAAGKPTIIVLNKVDLIGNDPDRLHELKSRFDENVVFVSAATGEGIPTLLNLMGDMMVDRVSRLRLRIPQARQDVIALLHRDGKVVSTDYENNDVLLTAIVPHPMRHHVDPFIRPDPKTEDRPSRR
ncbi:MAG: GTPase HflX, partial [Verrucomicrobiota bacterium]